MRLVLLLWMALLLVAPVPAHAAPPARSAKDLIKQASRLYDQKKYVEAAEALEKANELEPNSTLLYNIARAYDQAGQQREAITYYEQYMTEGEDVQLRKRSRSAVDRLRLQIQKDEAAQAQAEAERKRLQEETADAQRRVEEEHQASLRAEEANRQRLDVAYKDTLASRQRTKIASFALGGLAVAGLGFGVIFGVQAASAHKDFDNAPDVATKIAARESTLTKAHLADVGYGVALVSAVAAVILYPRQAAPVPGEARLISAPRGAGAGVAVSF